MTVRTRAELLADFALYLADNNAGDISPADVRQRFIDFAESVLMPEDPFADTSAHVDTYTTAGGATWSKPATGTVALIQCWAAGASGARGTSGFAGSGGGGGAYVERRMLLSELASTVSVNVGAGGAARTTNATNGQAGGNSSFGAHVVAYGGAGGFYDSGTGTGGGGGGGGSTSSGTASSGTTGGAGGSPSGSDFGGGAGGGTGAAPSSTGGESVYGGGGGGGGRAGSNAGGIGGASMYGGGGGGGGGNGPAAGGASLYGGSGGAGADGSSVASAGAQPGGGGGGSESGNSGKGGDGMVRITVW